MIAARDRGTLCRSIHLVRGSSIREISMEKKSGIMIRLPLLEKSNKHQT